VHSKFVGIRVATTISYEKLAIIGTFLDVLKVVKKNKEEKKKNSFIHLWVK